MRVIIAACLALHAVAARAQPSLYEADVTIMPADRAMMDQLAEPAVGMIRAKGWRCDSISAMRKWLTSRGFTVICNQYSYEYEFADRGGNWIVELK